jgi:hypothetical protein
MAENRLKREMEVRSTQERPKQWMPAELLPEPDKEPGFAYRWIRVATLNQNDPRNLSGKLREGWEPVAVEEQPKFKLLVDPNSRFAGNIEIGGLLLCKTPQTNAVDNNLMRQSDPRMPIFNERKSTTSFGKGS